MVAPLSAKLNQKMQLDQSKALADEKRKQELQEIKLQDAEAKANLGILFSTRKEIIDEAIKLANAGIKSPVPPLPAVPQASSGIPEFTPGGDDQVATVKTGEAIIPVESAQDPKNKAIIAQLVDEGRQAQGYKRGTVSIPKPTKGLTGMTQQENMLPIIPVVGRRKKMQGYEKGTIGATDDQILENWLQQNEKYQSATSVPKPYDAAWTAARESGPAGTAAKNPNSSASGLYQMTDAAWIDAIRKNPSLQKMDRADKTTQELGRSTYRAVLADRLTAQGIEPTDKALAQAWFIGPAGLGNVAKGDPNAPLAVSPSARSLNPALQNVTNAEFLAKDDPYSRTPIAAIPTPRNLARDQQMTHGPKQFSGDYQRAPAIPRPGESQTVDSGGFRNSAEAKIMDYNTSGLNRVNSIPSLASRYLNNRNEPVTQLETTVQVPPPEPQDSSLEEINKHFSDTTRDNQSALIEIRRQGDGITGVEEKKNFFERMLSNIYGRDDSLVNPATAARFIAGAALGMASGGSTNGSIRWAAQDTLRNYDQLHQQEASDNRVINAQVAQDMRAEASSDRKDRSTMAKFYREQGVSESDIKKFMETGDTKHLSNRAVNLQWDGSTRLVTPNNGDGAGQPLTVKTFTDKFSGNKVDMVSVGGKWGPLDAYTQQLNRGNKGTPVVLVPHTESTSESGRMKPYEVFGEDVAKSIERAYKSVEHLQGKEVNTDLLPDQSRVAQEVTKYAKQRGIRMTDVDTKLEMQGVTNNARDDMMRDHRANPKTQVGSIVPYLENARMKMKAPGLSEDLFYDKKAKLMPITRRMNMYEQVATAASKTAGKETPESILQKLAVAWKDTNNLQARQRYIASDNNSAFYNYVMEMTKTK